MNVVVGLPSFRDFTKENHNEALLHRLPYVVRVCRGVVSSECMYDPSRGPGILFNIYVCDVNGVWELFGPSSLWGAPKGMAWRTVTSLRIVVKAKKCTIGR